MNKDHAIKLYSSKFDEKDETLFHMAFNLILNEKDIYEVKKTNKSGGGSNAIGRIPRDDFR